MRIIAKTILLKEDPELIREYLAHHKKVCPSVLEQLVSSGVKESKIFLSGNQLFCVSIVDDTYDKNHDGAQRNAEADEWNKVMMNYQIPVPETGPNEWWHIMNEVYCLSEQYEKAFKTPIK